MSYKIQAQTSPDKTNQAQGRKDKTRKDAGQDKPSQAKTRQDKTDTTRQHNTTVTVRQAKPTTQHNTTQHNTKCRSGTKTTHFGFWLVTIVFRSMTIGFYFTENLQHFMPMDNFANQPNINPNFAASTHTKMPDTNSVCGLWT